MELENWQKEEEEFLFFQFDCEILIGTLEVEFECFCKLLEVQCYFVHCVCVCLKQSSNDYHHLKQSNRFFFPRQQSKKDFVGSFLIKRNRKKENTPPLIFFFFESYVKLKDYPPQNHHNLAQFIRDLTWNFFTIVTICFFFPKFTTPPPLQNPLVRFLNLKTKKIPKLNLNEIAEEKDENVVVVVVIKHLSSDKERKMLKEKQFNEYLS